MSPIVLAPMGALYGAITRTRLALYRRGLLTVHHLPAPVISIGNITTGGTGKTPLVEFVCRALAREGKKVCVLTRGYGRHEAHRRVLVSNGKELLADEKTAGDEARLLAEELIGSAAVVSDADRFGAGQWAITELHAEVFVLDDAFQHLRLARDLNIAVIDATRPFGNGHLLPWGHLREPARGLSRADCIVVTRVDQAGETGSLCDQINRFSGNKPICLSSMQTRGLRRLGETSASVSRNEIVQPTAAFCGIGNPGSFVKHLEGEGFTVSSVTAFPDHHRYAQKDVKQIVSRARASGAHSLITTAKDAVKLNGFSFDLPCYVLDSGIRLDDEGLLLRLIQQAAVTSRST